MSQKQKAWLKYMEAQKRDEAPCARPGCGHPRGQHVGDKNCSFRQINQCTCPQFVPKGAAS